jgi:hypothetical protein
LGSFFFWRHRKNKGIFKLTKRPGEFFGEKPTIRLTGRENYKQKRPLSSCHSGE